MAVFVYINDRGELKYEDSGAWDTGLNVGQNDYSDLATDDDLLEDEPWFGEDSLEDFHVHSMLDSAEAAGKGDIYRPVDKEEYNKNHDTVFGAKPKHVCRKYIRDNQGVSVCYFCGEPEIDTVTK